MVRQMKKEHLSIQKRIEKISEMIVYMKKNNFEEELIKKYEEELNKLQLDEKKS